MSIQVQELIEKIKSEAFEAAEKEAEKIIAGAKEKADRIIKDARAEAASHKAQTESEIKKQEIASRDALKQAARDILIGLEKQIIAQFEAILAESVHDALSPELTEKLIMDLAQAWADKGEEGLKIVLSSQDARALETALKGKLSRRFKEGVEIIPSRKFSRGFRLGGKDGALYNFSSEGIAEVLAETLSSDLAKTLKEAI